MSIRQLSALSCLLLSLVRPGFASDDQPQCSVGSQPPDFPVAYDLRASAFPQPRPVAVEVFGGVIPQVVDGAGWQTSFFLTNLDSQTAYFAVFFSDNTGELMPLPLVGFGPSYRVAGKLDPNQSLEFKTPGIGSVLIEGSAQLFALDRSADDPNAKVVLNTIGAYAVFRQRIVGHPDFEAVVPMSSPFDSTLTIFFDNRAGFSTGVAVVNAGVDASSVNVVARDLQGGRLLADAFTISSSEKRVFSVPQRYPALAGKAGILQFSTRGSSLSGLGLRFAPGGAFTSAHSLSLPTP